MQTIYLNLYQKSVAPVLYAKQGEVGRKFKVIISDGQEGYTIPGDAALSVWYSGASGEGNYTKIGDRSAFVVEGDTVTVELITQMLNNKGNGKLCLYMSKADGTQLGTWNIPYVVEEVPGFDSEGAKEYYNAFSEVVAAAKKFTVFAPRAQVRPIRFAVDDVAIFFEDVCTAFDSNTPCIGNFSYSVYGLEAHNTNSTTQRVFKSADGGETWSEHASLPIDAANGKWFTDLFADPKNKNLILLKTTDGFARKNNRVCRFFHNGQEWYNNPDHDLLLGEKYWLGNNNCIDVCTSADWSQRAIIFGEYGTTTDGTTYSLWKSTNNGTSWKKVLELNGNSGGAAFTGEIRHWHTVQADPYTKHWWASSGDGDAQCRIYRSTDNGENWELMFSGSQRERTCCFVFEQDCIYYGMDSTNNADKNSIKIVKIDKSKLDTDRANCREDVAVVDSAFAVYGLSRTYFPDGFIVWAQQEPGASYTPGRYILQFYDYATKKMYPIAYFDTSSIANDKYIGFYAGSRFQNALSGCIFAKPTAALNAEKYGHSYVSSHVKINLTM